MEAFCARAAGHCCGNLPSTKSAPASRSRPCRQDSKNGSHACSRLAQSEKDFLLLPVICSCRRTGSALLSLTYAVFQIHVLGSLSASTEQSLVHTEASWAANISAISRWTFSTVQLKQSQRSLHLSPFHGDSQKLKPSEGSVPEERMDFVALMESHLIVPT